MPEPADLERDLALLETDLRRLEGEYNMFFAGRLPRPPWETRRRVEQAVKRLDRAYISNYADRFRFSTLQSRYAAFVDLWDRGLRAREEGRPGPFAARRGAAQPPAAVRLEEHDRILHVAAFIDPVREIDKLQELYDRVVEARQSVGEKPVPFHRFAALIKEQVKQLRKQGAPEVAFRVAVKDGKVNFTVRALRGTSS